MLNRFSRNNMSMDVGPPTYTVIHVIYMLYFRVTAFDTIFNTELGKYVSKCRVRFRTQDEVVNPDT